jgi:hypothetical protein
MLVTAIVVAMLSRPSSSVCIFASFILLVVDRSGEYVMLLSLSSYQSFIHVYRTNPQHNVCVLTCVWILVGPIFHLWIVVAVVVMSPWVALWWKQIVHQNWSVYLPLPVLCILTSVWRKLTYWYDVLCVLQMVSAVLVSVLLIGMSLYQWHLL